MGATNKFNVYFPLNNLNPQGWISEFITPVISKTDIDRSDVANLFYDKYLTPKNEENLIQQGFTKNEIEDLKVMRKELIEDDKMLFLNGNFLDAMEIDATLRDSAVVDEDLVKYTNFMSTAKPYQLAFLQSYISIKYGYRENKKEPYTWISFPFTQKFNLDFILNNKLARSEGCGINSINVEHQLNLSTQINSNFSIDYIFGNLNILTQEITENGDPIEQKNSPYPFGFSFTKLVANLDTTKEVIKLEYGRKVADGFEKFASPELKSIIEKKEKKEFLLNKTSHNFSFDEKGLISLSVSYMNFHDVTMLSPNNIAVPNVNSKSAPKLNLVTDYGKLLDSYQMLKETVSDFEEKLQNAKKIVEAETVDKTNSEQTNVKIKDITEKLGKANKTLNLLKRSIKPTLTTALLDQIKAQGQLFAINFNTIKEEKTFKLKTNIYIIDPSIEGNGDFRRVFSYDTNYNVDSFLKNGKYPELSKAASPDLITRIYSRIFNSPYNDTTKNQQKTYGHIMFFPLKALISAAYSFLDTKEKDIIPYMLFGNVLMKVGDKLCSINIGDLLIETTVFQKWYYDKFFKKDKLEYAFGAFLTDVITDLVPEALYRNRVGFDDKAPTSAVKQIKYYLNENVEEQLKYDLYWKNNREDLKRLANIMSKNPTSNPKPLIYFGQINNPTTQVPSPTFSNLGISEFNFNETNDASKGIPHIKVGADGGFFTNISFSSLDFPKIRTALTLESLADKSSRYFFSYYQLGIEMIGNHMFSYDSVVCVPSNPLGIDSEENDIGIAGYYKVKSLRDSLDANNSYISSATADWVFNPKSKDREKQKISPAQVADTNIKDYLELSVNNPENYLIELLENDANGVINSQLQKLAVPEKKTAEQAKKDKESDKNKKNKTKVDKEEKLTNAVKSPE